MISLIVAFDEKFGIGKNNDLPWKLKKVPIGFWDDNATDANASSADAPLVISDVNATLPVVAEGNASTVDEGNGSK